MALTRNDKIWSSRRYRTQPRYRRDLEQELHFLSSLVSTEKGFSISPHIAHLLRNQIHSHLVYSCFPPRCDASSQVAHHTLLAVGICLFTQCLPLLNRFFYTLSCLWFVYVHTHSLTIEWSTTHKWGATEELKPVEKMIKTHCVYIVGDDPNQLWSCHTLTPASESRGVEG